jgi:hypothetical protein
LNASTDGYYDLSVDGQTLHLVSVDGVPIKTYPGAQEQDVHDVVIPLAGRAEFLVTGKTAATAFRTTCFEHRAGRRSESFRKYWRKSVRCFSVTRR